MKLQSIRGVEGTGDKKRKRRGGRGREGRRKGEGKEENGNGIEVVPLIFQNVTYLLGYLVDKSFSPDGTTRINLLRKESTVSASCCAPAVSSRTCQLEAVE